MPRQLTFDLPPPHPAAARDDFIVAPSNAQAVAMLDRPGDWPGGRLVLTGAAGSGKSHLAGIVATEWGASPCTGADLGRADVPALAEPGIAVIEDAEAVAGDPAAEAAMFHLMNLIQAEGGRLLLTAARPPARWPVALPDLRSRLMAMAEARITPPEDALLAQLLVKLFADRQLRVAPQVVAWLVARMERAPALARDLVAALDARALERGAPISRALAAEVLADLTAARPDPAPELPLGS
ncbi:chromosomal replication initiator DnaA [Paracoccus sp. p3-h83]|uniref:chromosomal replication initiator DnaA n=1 Tax=Paracoccus sp. p3-h83 TaxID=3342805 RepID=UPI0035B6CCC5